MRRAAIIEVVTVDRRDDDVIEPDRATASATLAGSSAIERPRQARAHIAERAGARAGVAHDHQRRVPLGPALADVGAAGFLAHRVQAVLAHDGPSLGQLPLTAGTRTRIQLGLRSTGVSGLLAFSGCRGARLSRMVTIVGKSAASPLKIKPNPSAVRPGPSSVRAARSAADWPPRRQFPPALHQRTRSERLTPLRACQLQ